MRSLVPLEASSQIPLALKVGTLEDPDHPQELQEELQHCKLGRRSLWTASLDANSPVHRYLPLRKAFGCSWFL